METIKFKTNIKCSACVEKVTPGLNEVAGEGKWEVDITNPSKILTVAESVDEKLIKESLKKVGYQAERLKD
jgi:copper chaperone CopZ